MIVDVDKEKKLSCIWLWEKTLSPPILTLAAVLHYNTKRYYERDHTETVSMPRQLREFQWGFTNQPKILQKKTNTQKGGWEWSLIKF